MVDPSNEEVVGVYEKDGRFDGMTFDEIYEKIKNVVENKEVFEEIESTTEETEESEEDSEVYVEMEINEYAEKLMGAALSVLVEVDEEDLSYDNKAVICSDSSKSINAIPEGKNENYSFTDELKYFFDNVNNSGYEYALFIDGCDCMYAAVVDPSSKEVVVNYFNEEEDGKFDGMTFDEIYEEMKNSIE